MNNDITQELVAIPPGHEKVSDDLLIYCLPNWNTSPDYHHDNGRKDADWLSAVGAVTVATVAAVAAGILLF